MPAADASPDFTPAELEGLLAPFARHSHVVIALSGGPDSTALTVLAHRWRAARATGPVLSAATVDHGLRPEARAEAEAAGRLCARLGLAHSILPWTGPKPASGLQEAARDARYARLVAHAEAVGADAIGLAHTQDDQAETVLFRLGRGSGLAGLAGMRARTRRRAVDLIRPFLDLPKARLLAHLDALGIAYARDPSNLDLRHARPRLRALAPALAVEGLTSARLAALARRLARADDALSRQAERVWEQCLLDRGAGGLRFDAARLFVEPDEISLRVLLDALGAFASEGAVELAKAERLHGALVAAARDGKVHSGTLAGAVARLDKGTLSVATAPKRNKKTPAIAANSPP